MKTIKHNSVDVEKMLHESGISAPAETTSMVMNSLRDNSMTSRNPRVIKYPWILPAMYGAAAALIVACLSALLFIHLLSGRVYITFELDAPEAEHIELVGSFNGWIPGEILLKDSNKDGRWKVTVPLNEGRHEYMFIVDGKTWIADPRSTHYRPDGFGRKNSVLEI